MAYKKGIIWIKFWCYILKILISSIEATRALELYWLHKKSVFMLLLLLLEPSRLKNKTCASSFLLLSSGFSIFWSSLRLHLAIQQWYTLYYYYYACCCCNIFSLFVALLQSQIFLTKKSINYRGNKNKQFNFQKWEYNINAH